MKIFFCGPQSLWRRGGLVDWDALWGDANGVTLSPSLSESAEGESFLQQIKRYLLPIPAVLCAHSPCAGSLLSTHFRFCPFIKGIQTIEFLSWCLKVLEGLCGEDAVLWTMVVESCGHVLQSCRRKVFLRACCLTNKQEDGVELSHHQCLLAWSCQ